MYIYVIYMLYIHTHTHTHTHICIPMNLHTQTHTYIYIYPYTHNTEYLTPGLHLNILAYSTFKSLSNLPPFGAKLVSLVCPKSFSVNVWTFCKQFHTLFSAFTIASAPSCVLGMSSSVCMYVCMRHLYCICVCTWVFCFYDRFSTHIQMTHDTCIHTFVRIKMVRRLHAHTSI